MDRESRHCNCLHLGYHCKYKSSISDCLGGYKDSGSKFQHKNLGHSISDFLCSEFQNKNSGYNIGGYPGGRYEGRHCRGTRCDFSYRWRNPDNADPFSSNASRNWRIKRVITPGKWRKGKLLGRGAFASVYEATSEDGFDFAVKEVSLLDEGNQGRQSVYQLEQEIEHLSRFQHKNIVRYFGTETDESNLYIFLELVNKGSLRKIYQESKLLDSEVSAYSRQILYALKCLHDQSIVHRDIKCANILLDANGTVKLSDFGAAKAIKLNDIQSFWGSVFWMAPEGRCGRSEQLWSIVCGVIKVPRTRYGLPVDIWSLGCTVLEMLTCQNPYYPLEIQQAMYKLMMDVPPAVPDSLSRDARGFILQCLKVNPDERPTVAQLLKHPFVQMRLPTYLVL